MDLYPEPAGVNTEEAEQFRVDMGIGRQHCCCAVASGGLAALLTVFSDDQVGRFVIANV